MTHPLTDRQREVLEFIREHSETAGVPPSLREIARHFKFDSANAAHAHVQALRRKGHLQSQPGRARSLRVTAPHGQWRGRIADIPIYGSIPAGFARDREQDVKGCISIDVNTLGLRPTARTFALQVRGDSMIGKHIVEGDYVILEHGMTPRPGDVVAALIDNESTLKTFALERGKPVLRAENPKYPKLIPAQELVIQGVMVALIRRM